MARLDLDVTVDPVAKKISVDGTMNVRLEDPESSGLALILNSRAKAMRFAKVTAEGIDAAILPFEGNDAVEVALLRLPRRFRRGDSVEVCFSTFSERESSQLVIREQASFASWVETWYPVPATIKKGPASPKAPGSTTVRLPKGWRSVSNGVLATSGHDEKGAWERWESESPVARSFVAAPFAEVKTVEREGRSIRFFLLSDRDSAGAQAKSLAQAIRVMEERFGPYPYGGYSVAEVPEGTKFAASSEQGFIMVRSSVLDKVSASLPLFAHEAAHGWWGNLVQTDGDGSKMADEALAQFGAVMSIEAIEGEPAMSRFLRFSRDGYNPLQSAVGFFYMQRDGGDKPLSRLAGDKWDHNLADSKGMWFYQMLRRKVGDEIFFAVLRSLIHDYAGKQLTLAGLRERFRAVSGDPALESFMAQWLDRRGAPVLDVDWWSQDRGKAIEIHLKQLQTGDAYSFPLEIEIELVDGTLERKTLEVNAASHAFELDTRARPVALRIDPEFRVFMWRPEYGPRPKP
jgi:aminopeptidase N